MKMNKKLLALMMSTMLAVPFVVGCNDNNVTEELPQTQIEEQQPQEQQKPVDEDLNDEYKAKIDERQQQSDVEDAKKVINAVMNEFFPDIKYRIIEENGLLGIVLDIPTNDVAFTSIEEWNKLVDIIVEYDLLMQQYLQQFGVNVPTATMVANTQRDEAYLLISNGEVMYDVFNGIDRIN